MDSGKWRSSNDRVVVGPSNHTCHKLKKSELWDFKTCESSYDQDPVVAIKSDRRYQSFQLATKCNWFRFMFFSC